MGKLLLSIYLCFSFVFLANGQSVNVDSLKNLAETAAFPKRLNHLISWYSETGELFHEHEIAMMQTGIDWLEGRSVLDEKQQLTWAVLSLMQGSMFADNERLHDLFQNASKVVVMADSVGGDSEKWLIYKGQAYFQLSSVSSLEERFEESLSYLEKAKSVFEKLENNMLTARALNSMGAQHSELGNYEKAIALSAQAADLYQKEGSEYGYLRATFYQAASLIELKKMGEAERLLLEIMPRMKETGHVSLNAALASLGEVQGELGKIEAAENNLTEALVMAKERRVNYTVANVCQSLANLEEGRGNFAEALFYQREQARYADSIRLQATERELKRAQAEFEQLENQQKIKELEQKIAAEKQTKTIIVGAGVGILALAFGLFWHFYQKKKKELEAAARTVSLRINTEPASKDSTSLDPFLDSFLEMIKTRMGEEGLSVERLAESMKMSRVQLFKKVKAATGASPSAIIREYRLEAGKKLLLEHSLTISEVAYRVGFSSPNSFSRAFKGKFGSSPSEFITKNKGS